MRRYNLKVKQSFETFIGNNCEQSIAVDKIVLLANKYGLFLSDDLDQYESGRRVSKRRLFTVFLLKLATFLTAVRYFLSSVFYSRTVVILMSDASYLFGKPRIISMVLCMASFNITVLEQILHSQELRQTSKLLIFLNNYKHKRILQMKAFITRRLTIQTNLLIKYIYEFAFWPLVISSSALYAFASIVAYLDPNSGFMLISIIFWSNLLIVLLIKVYAIIGVFFVITRLTTLYLKHKFKETHEMVECSLKLRNVSLLMKAITEHNSIAKQTKELNEFYNLAIFVLYYMASPALMLLMYIVQSKDTAVLMRLVGGAAWLVAFFVFFYLNLMVSQISHWANKPYPLLYIILLRNKLSTAQRWKIMTFIEKLSGPYIGFFCWNLFPMNNYQYYKFVTNCAIVYFLILKFV